LRPSFLILLSNSSPVILRQQPKGRDSNVGARRKHPRQQARDFTSRPNKSHIFVQNAN
jgi:hypothetical protein